MPEPVSERPEAGRLALAPSDHKVFWLDGVAQDVSFPTLAGTVDADPTVVGGDYRGLWTAMLA